MISKKIVKYLLAVLLIIMAGCDNFLAEKSRDIVSPDSYFKSDAEAKSAVTGLYALLHRGSLYGLVPGLYQSYENGADTEGPNRQYGAVEPLQSYTLNAGNLGGEGDGLRGTWQDLYKIIQNANLIISKITDNQSLSESGRNQALGQTLFIRSLAYYHLTNLWGDIPYYRKNLPLSEVQVLGQTDKTEIRKDMVQDLSQAAGLLPDKYPESDKGRATKWAVKTLKVKFDLWLKDWQDAKTTADDIINNSSLQLLNNYAEIFKASNEYNDEIIFQIVWAKDLIDQRFTDFFTPRIRDEPKDNANRAALQDSLQAHNLGLTGYGLAIPLPDLVNKWPDDDLRKKGSIGNELYGYRLKFPYFRKMWDLDQINSPRGNHGDNFIVFRLGEVYLMAAEAENELNGPANAYKYINKLRERAFEPNKSLSGLSKKQFRAAVHEEYKWELAGEGKRRMELIRWDTLLETVKNTEYRVYDPASHIMPYNKLLPIPAEEIQLNPNLTQNPGYGK